MHIHARTKDHLSPASPIRTNERVFRLFGLREGILRKEQAKAMDQSVIDMTFADNKS
jgi:hypothetical protein